MKKRAGIFQELLAVVLSVALLFSAWVKPLDTYYASTTSATTPVPIKTYSFDDLTGFIGLEKQNAPKLVNDSEKGSVLRLGAPLEGVNSQAEIVNPFAGSNLSQVPDTSYGAPQWTNGVTMEYWIKVPGSVEESVLLAFNNTSNQVMQGDDEDKYNLCKAYDVEAAKGTISADSVYYIGPTVTYVDASDPQKEYMVYTSNGRYANYNPNYVKGYRIDQSGEIRAYEKGGNSSNLVKLSVFGEPMYGEYSRRFQESGGENSKIREGIVKGSLQIAASSSFSYREDDGTALQLNPNASNYEKTQAMHGHNYYYFFGREYNRITGVHDGQGSTATTKVKDIWHRVTVVIQNDLAKFYVDGNAVGKKGINAWGEYGYGTAGKAFHLGYGIREHYTSNNPILGNKYGTTMVDFLTMNTTTLTIGGRGVAAATMNQGFETGDGVLLDDLTFYDVPLTEEQVQKTMAAEKIQVSNAPKTGMERKELDLSDATVKATFANGMQITAPLSAEMLSYEDQAGEQDVTVKWHGAETSFTIDLSINPEPDPDATPDPALKYKPIAKYGFDDQKTGINDQVILGWNNIQNQSVIADVNRAGKVLQIGRATGSGISGVEIKNPFAGQTQYSQTLTQALKNNGVTYNGTIADEDASGYLFYKDGRTYPYPKYTNGLTISMWAKLPEGRKADSTLLAFVNYADRNAGAGALRISAAGNVMFFQGTANKSYDRNNYVFENAGNSLLKQAGQWVHVCITIENDHVGIYYSGQEAKGTAVSDYAYGKTNSKYFNKGFGYRGGFAKLVQKDPKEAYQNYRDLLMNFSLEERQNNDFSDYSKYTFLNSQFMLLVDFVLDSNTRLMVAGDNGTAIWENAKYSTAAAGLELDDMAFYGYAMELDDVKKTFRDQREKYGVEEPTPEPTPTPTPSPVPTATVLPTETPKPTEIPKPTEVPKPTETVSPTSAPDETKTPIPTTIPDETKIPAPTATPDETKIPAPTATPDETKIPAPTATPDETKTPEPVCYYLGDVDMDGKVLASDALAILKHVVKLQVFQDEREVWLADVDKNQQIAAADALEVLKIVVKLRQQKTTIF